MVRQRRISSIAVDSGDRDMGSDVSKAYVKLLSRSLRESKEMGSQAVGLLLSLEKSSTIGESVRMYLVSSLIFQLHHELRRDARLASDKRVSREEWTATLNDSPLWSNLTKVLRVLHVHYHYLIDSLPS